MKGSTSRHDLSHTGVARPAWEHLLVWGDRVCLYTIFNFGYYGVEGGIRVGVDKENHGHLHVINIFDFTMSIGIAQLPTSIPGGNVFCSHFPLASSPFPTSPRLFLSGSHSYP